MMNELINRILKEGNLDRETLQHKIKEKVEEYSGLVSEEGALYLIAKELGLEFSEKIDKKELKIENIVPGMWKVDFKGKVMKISEKNKFKREDGSEGVVQSLLLGDETGVIRVVLWNEQTEIADKIEVGDVIEIKGASSRESIFNFCEVHLNRHSIVRKINDEINVNVEKINMFSYEKLRINEISHENALVEFEGILFNLREGTHVYHSCPECGGKIRYDSEKYFCEVHGEVHPVKNIFFSGLIDDGFGCIRAVFFRESAKKLLNVSDEDVEKMSEDEINERLKKLSGINVRVKGRVSKNEFLNTLEVIVNDVSEINVKEKLKEWVEVE